MASEGTHFFASREIPYLDRVIPTSTDESLFIWTDGQTTNTICMAGESAYFLASREIPHLDRVICASTDECLSVWTDRHTGDNFSMAGESVQQSQLLDRKRCYNKRRNFLDLLSSELLVSPSQFIFKLP